MDNNPRSSCRFRVKPDVSVYPARTDDVKTNSALVEMFIEFKWDKEDSPFDDVKDKPYPDNDDKSSNDADTSTSGKRFFIRNFKRARDTLGQITSYASAQLSAQFRTHIFSVLIVCNTARLLRWDRTGTIVTDAFKYNESPFLAEFFSRYSNASDARRGKDESVSKPSSEEETTARRLLPYDVNVPLVKLSIPDLDGPRYFITSTPEAAIYTPAGRATRGFMAHDISENKLVFVKDSWRIDMPDIQAEGMVYKALTEANVRNVPHCVASGDILSADYHATKTHTYSKEEWACAEATHLIPHRHHRLCLDLVGRVLVGFKSSREMVSAVRDALVGELSQCGLI